MPAPQAKTREETRSSQGTYASVVENWTCTTETKNDERSVNYFGKKSIADISIFGMSAQALLDTGSQATIIPVKLLKRAVKEGVNLDPYVERLPSPDATIRDASGNPMTFMDTIKVSIGLNGEEKSIPSYVGRCFDEMVILGTDALESFNLELVHAAKVESGRNPQEREGLKAQVARRTFVPPGATKLVAVTCASVSRLESPVFTSQHPLIVDGICATSGKETYLPVTNNTPKALCLKEAKLWGNGIMKISPPENEETSTDLEQSVVICGINAEDSEWLKELREDQDYKEIIRELEAGNDSKDVKLPRYGEGDNAPLGFFYRCPGRLHGEDSFSCSIRDKRFKDVVPDAGETLRDIRFDTIFSLARLISIYESERSDDSRRLLMIDPKYPYVSITGAQKAFTFFMHCCHHVFRSLTLHDGSLLSLPHDGGTGCPINELNDLNNEGVRFAKMHSWDDVMAATQDQTQTLLLLPDGFRDVNSTFKPQRNVDRRIYWKLSDIISQLETTGARSCVIVGPTTDVGPAKRDWCRLASALAAAARNGTRTIVVAPPRGDAAYAQNRLELIKAAELAKKSVPLMSRNIVSLIPLMESSSEPSHGPSAHPRESSTDAYSDDTMVEYLTAMLDYIKAEVQLPRLVRTLRRAQRVREHFQERKARYRGAGGAHSSQDTHYASSSHRPTPYPAASRGSRGASYRRRFYGHPPY
ncbi:Zinc knuckle [Trichostrongylus colubriformis]|uniref:Zinc knuckle n=1 Tax=Trichostrongylus colubriformis TaxID=6319 RepID=A0AAN8FEX9_TRICO